MLGSVRRYAAALRARPAGRAGVTVRRPAAAGASDWPETAASAYSVPTGTDGAPGTAPSTRRYRSSTAASGAQRGGALSAALSRAASALHHATRLLRDRYPSTPPYGRRIATLESDHPPVNRLLAAPSGSRHASCMDLRRR